MQLSPLYRFPEPVSAHARAQTRPQTEHAVKATSPIPASASFTKTLASFR